MGKAFSLIVEAEKESTDEVNDNFKELVSCLNDAGKILTDLQYYLSLSRRSYIAGYMDPIVKRCAEDSKIDEYLFGLDFAEKLKAAQAVEKSSKSLSKATKKTNYPSNKKLDYTSRSRPSTSTQYGRDLNYHGPSKKYNYQRQKSSYPEGQKSRKFKSKSK